MKRYVIKEAYTDNYHVLQYVDEKLESHAIVAYYKLDGFISALKGMGYVQAYYLPEYSAKLDEAEALYQSAKDEYREAAKNRLDLSDEEKKKYEKITHFSR